MLQQLCAQFIQYTIKPLRRQNRVRLKGSIGANINPLAQDLDYRGQVVNKDVCDCGYVKLGCLISLQEPTIPVTPNTQPNVVK